MRWKIILVNGGIVLVLSLVTFFLLKSSLATAVSDSKLQRDDLAQAINAAEARLSLDALMAERWLDRAADEESVRNVFDAGTAAARSDSATAKANQLRDQAVAHAEFAQKSPALVLFVDADGNGVGRNGSELMRGDKVAEAYPSLAASLKSGDTASDLWVNEKRQEQLLASYAPVRDLAGKVLGAVIIATPLNDERLARTSELTSGHSLALVVGENRRPIAVGGKRLPGFDSEEVAQAVQQARGGTMSHTTKAVGGFFFAAAPVPESSAIIIGAIPTSLVPSVEALLWPVFAVGILGLFLVLTGGILLGNYLSKPIEEIEEGLLLVMNGQQDLRFDLDHDDLGGLTSRINGLLNSILGVPEGEGGNS